MGNRHRIVKGVAIGHQRGGGQNPRLMKFSDGSVDARRKAEVVRVDDEAGWHGGSIGYEQEGWRSGGQ